MTLLLGVDTGGTYTDAVLIRDEAEVIASAKALTTRHDLAIGVGNVVRAVLAEAEVAAGDVSLASLSTTLATNALVEGQGGRVALIYIGFRERDLAAHGLAEALKGDPYLILEGGHNHAGGQAAPLDEATLIESAKKTSRVIVVDEGHQSFGITGEIASRINEKAFYHLDAPVLRMGAMDVPVPFSPALEDITVPTPERVAEMARRLCAGEMIHAA